MQPNTYQIFLRDAVGGNYYTVNAGGAVVTTSTPTPIQHLPLGWNEIEIPISRSTQNLGLLTQTTSTYKFVLDGAKILRHIFHTQGTAATCFIEVYKTESANWTYYLYYKGQFDFTTYDADNDFVSIDIEQGGLNALLYREEDTVYEIPILATDPDVTPVVLDGVALRNKSMLRMLGSVYAYWRGIPGISVQSNESEIGVAIIAQQPTNADLNTTRDAHPFFEAKADGVVTVNYDLIVHFGSPTGVSFSPAITIAVQIYHKKVSGTDVEVTLYSETTTAHGPRPIAGSQTFNMAVGDQLIIYSSRIDTGSYADVLTMIWQKGIVFVSYNTRQEPTNALANRYGRVLEKLLAKVDATATVSPNVFNTPSSQLLDFSPYDLLLLPSESVRGIADAKFKVAYKDFLKDLPRYGLGASVSGSTLNIRPVTDFFTNSLLAHLGDIQTVKIAPALKYLFSTLKAGAKAGDNDALQGRYEINAPQLWKVQFAKVEGEYDMTSPFISGMYAIEQIRSNRVKETTNQSDDNRILLLDGDPYPYSPNYCPRRPQNNSGNYADYLLDDAAEETAFNLSQSPTRDIMRNSAVMALQMTYAGTGPMAFVSAEREGTMQSKLSAASGAILERSVVFASSPPFLPVLFQFEAPAPIGFYAAFQSNPHGYLSFEYRGDLCKGYIDEVKIKPGGGNDPGMLVCSLLAHPDTDLNTLTF